MDQAHEELKSSLAFTSSKSSDDGLRLNLAYHLVRAMGGELRHEVEEQRTRFCFYLVASDLDVQSVTPVRYRPVFSKEKHYEATRHSGLDGTPTSSPTMGRRSDVPSELDDSFTSASFSLPSFAQTFRRQPSEAMNHFVLRADEEVVTPASVLASVGIKALQAPHGAQAPPTARCIAAH